VQYSSKSHQWFQIMKLSRKQGGGTRGNTSITLDCNGTKPVGQSPLMLRRPGFLFRLLFFFLIPYASPFRPSAVAHPAYQYLKNTAAFGFNHQCTQPTRLQTCLLAQRLRPAVTPSPTPTKSTSSSVANGEYKITKELFPCPRSPRIVC